MQEPVDQDPRSLVAEGYNRCAEAYAMARSPSPPTALLAFARQLGPGSHILDVGCGSGLPVARFLASSFDVTGVDISARQIELCRKNVPEARLICGDIMTQRFPPGSFDSIVAMYSLFHLPRSEHGTLFELLRRWLRRNGIAFLTLADTPEEANVEDDFFGARMYWSSHSLDVYRGLLTSSGFQIVQTGTLGSGFSDASGCAAEQHPFFVVEKGPGGGRPAVAADEALLSPSPRQQPGRQKRPDR